MKEFLKSVAEHYMAEAASAGAPPATALADCLFVFPNHRSGLFFRHYLAELSTSPVMAPATTTISEIFAKLADSRVTDRTALLFRLYALYRELSGSNEEFDNFVFWGDMLLGDFDDIDKYQVNARELFYNVRDIKEIDLEYSDYDPETVSIIRSFWSHFRPDSTDHKKVVFEHTWSILYDLYARFRDDLRADGLAYEGMQMRSVVEQLEAGGALSERLGELLPYRKVVFVGLTAISGVDRKLMLRLRMRGLAEFCWDYADPRLSDPASRAAYFTAANLADFPNALDDAGLQAGLVADADREIEVLAVPSGVGQTVQARDILGRWMHDGTIAAGSRQKTDPHNAFHTAIVLPDEKLLLPMLYAVPAALEPFNVTMGYSLKQTPVAGLIDDLMRLQTNVRRQPDGSHSFYYKPVLALLAHNYVIALAGRTAGDLSQQIVRESLFQVPAAMLSASPFLTTLFRRVNDAADALGYLQNLLGCLLHQASDDAACEEAGADIATPVFGAVEREFLYNYSLAVNRLGELMHSYSADFRLTTFFHLLQRLTQGIMVPFTGEPLSGLQVMGVLETRAVDFDNVIILSMNEGVFPAKPVSNTFIPMSLRTAFGLPTQRHRDAVFAYHFYRLLSRARRVALIYDTRTDGMQTGEMSRYLLQMQHLYHIKMNFRPVKYSIGIAENQPFKVEKSAMVMARLDTFRSGGPHALSASALKDYINCPLKFYLNHVERLSEDDEVTEGIDSSRFGSIFHDAMRRLYEPLCGRTVTADYLHRLVKDRTEISRAVEASFASVMNLREVVGYNHLVSEIIQEYVRNVLTHDAALCPFVYLASEFRQQTDYPVSPDLTVRLKCFYDRLDIDRQRSLRIVDYKTGSATMGYKLPKTQFNSLTGLFEADNAGCSDEAFQVMMYCLMMRHASPSDRQQMHLDGRGLYERTAPHLYFIREFHRTDLDTALTYKPRAGAADEDGLLPEGTVSDYAPFATKFEEAFRRTLTDIFDPTIPFAQCSGTQACRYCPFLMICKRDV